MACLEITENTRVLGGHSVRGACDHRGVFRYEYSGNAFYNRARTVAEMSAKPRKPTTKKPPARLARDMRLERLVAQKANTERRGDGLSAAVDGLGVCVGDVAERVRHLIEIVERGNVMAKEQREETLNSILVIQVGLVVLAVGVVVLAIKVLE